MPGLGPYRLPAGRCRASRPNGDVGAPLAARKPLAAARTLPRRAGHGRRRPATGGSQTSIVFWHAMQRVVFLGACSDWPGLEAQLAGGCRQTDPRRAEGGMEGGARAPAERSPGCSPASSTSTSPHQAYRRAAGRTGRGDSPRPTGSGTLAWPPPAAARHPGPAHRAESDLGRPRPAVGGGGLLQQIADQVGQREHRLRELGLSAAR